MILTEAQREWLTKNPQYVFIGPPRPGVKVDEFGTLYRDGRYVKSEPMRPIKLEAGCVGVCVVENKTNV